MRERGQGDPSQGISVSSRPGVDPAASAIM